MLKLMQNEIIKIWKRPAALIMVSFLLVLIVLAGAFTKYNVSKHTYGDNWKTVLNNENIEYISQLKKLDKGTIAYSNIKEDVAINEYRINHDIKPNSSINTWTFVKSVKPILSVVGLFTIIIAAGIVSSEFSWGTIKLIMIRSFSRTQILLSKYITVILFSFSLIFLLFIFSFCLGAILFGTAGDPVQLTYRNGHVLEENMVIHLVKYFLLSSVNIWMVSSMAFMISTVFRNNSLALGLSLFVYLTGEMAAQFLASRFDWAKYILFANTDLNMYVSGTVLVNGMTPIFSITILLIYLAAFLSVSFITFTQRDITF